MSLTDREIMRRQAVMWLSRATRALADSDYDGLVTCLENGVLCARNLHPGTPTVDRLAHAERLQRLAKAGAR